MSTQHDSKVVCRELVHILQGLELFQHHSMWKFAALWPSSASRKGILGEFVSAKLELIH